SERMFLSFLFLLSSNSFIIRLSKDPLSVSGKRSISAVTIPLFNRSLTSLELLRTRGAEIPKWVKRIFPVFENAFFPLEKKVIFMNERLVPETDLIQKSLARK